MPALEPTLERLCALLQEELERQETVLAVVQAQHDALLTHDIEYVEAKTTALKLLIAEAAKAEAARIALFREVVAHYGLPLEQQTLTGLIAAAPEPWRSRLRDFQVRLRKTLSNIRLVVAGNGRILRRSLEVVRESLETLSGCAAVSGSSYDAAGRQPGLPAAIPAVVDQKG